MQVVVVSPTPHLHERKHAQANSADVEHTACDIPDCISCIEYGPNMELLAADLWDPLGGGPGKAAVDSNPNGHINSVREIRNVQPTEPQMVTDEVLRSHMLRSQTSDFHTPTLLTKA